MSCLVMVRRKGVSGRAARGPGSPLRSGRNDAGGIRRPGLRSGTSCGKGGHIAHRSSVSVPFQPPRGTRRTLRMAAFAPPPARPANGSLFRAYRARARAGVGAGAVRAPDCAREAERTPLLSVSQVVLNRRQRGGKRPPDAASFLRPHIATGFLYVNLLQDIFLGIIEQTSGLAVLRPVRSRARGRDMRPAHAVRRFAMPGRFRQNGVP